MANTKPCCFFCMLNQESEIQMTTQAPLAIQKRNEPMYGVTTGALLCVIELAFKCVGFIKVVYEDEHGDVDILIDKSCDCAIIETDNHIVFGINHARYPQNEIFTSIQFLGDDVCEEFIREEIKKASGFEPISFFWFKKEVLIEYCDTLHEFLDEFNFNKWVEALQEPQNKKLSDQIGVTARDYYDMRRIAGNLQKQHK